MRVMRIELIPSAWKADNLPLIYTRISLPNTLHVDNLIQTKYKKWKLN
jgi:hypothetical protein